jgi:hypothetical protein
VGIPAPFAVGVSIPSARNEGGIDGYHCRAEFFADKKWWPVDMSPVLEVVGEPVKARVDFSFLRIP